MWDEDTGEDVECPYCGSDGDCPHLLAVIDRTFLTCNGGYAFERFGEFRTMLEEAFRKHLRTAIGASHEWKQYYLQELWNSASKQYTVGSDDVYLDKDVLFDLIIELLGDAGGDEYPGSIEDDGGPGYSSVIKLFHAEDPKVVFGRALSLLGTRLAE